MYGELIETQMNEISFIGGETGRKQMGRASSKSDSFKYGPGYF